jgi:hypothetical protein
MINWISVTEQLPSLDTFVLVWTDKSKILPFVGYLTDLSVDKVWVYPGSDDLKNMSFVTYWAAINAPK